MALEPAEAAAVDVFAVFGFGALGFFVGPALLDFFALEGDLGLAEAAVAAPPEAAFFFSAAFFPATFFSDEAAAAFLAFGDPAAFFGAFFSVAADFFAAPFLALAPTPFFLSPAADDVAPPLDDCLDWADELEAASLKEPDAPLPLVWTKVPDITADFKYFLINGATFSASTL